MPEMDLEEFSNVATAGGCMSQLSIVVLEGRTIALSTLPFEETNTMLGRHNIVLTAIQGSNPGD